MSGSGGLPTLGEAMLVGAGQTDREKRQEGLRASRMGEQGPQQSGRRRDRGQRQSAQGQRGSRAAREARALEPEASSAGVRQRGERRTLGGGLGAADRLEA